ncbi:protein LAZY 1-like [Rutidosis leptorrhynchoides]|uniref:protein LAZY 1-like n=1 Tax=Rutidosis leptorrhynchoides TaxID=125765 RepID=UPI003A9A0877
MKLLDWMHRKFRNGEPLKDFSTGNPCICLMGQPSLDDFEYYPKSNYYAKPSNKSRENQIRKSFACLEGAKTEDEHMEEESSEALTELFHGFLAIGTFGMDPVTSDPGTPTFATSVEYIMEKETEATENELQFINDELEKVLIVEGKEDDSSARNSYVSNGRSSQGSTITLSGKVLEAVSDNENGSVACPLQGYLFGSAVGLPETTAGKKEHRTSLGELFQKTKSADENSGNKCNRVDAHKEKETDNNKSAIQLMKKILKGKKGSGGTVDTNSADKKLPKILHMFHKKVHPDSTTRSKIRSKDHTMNVTYMNEEPYNKRNQLVTGEDITIIPKRDSFKNNVNNIRSNMPHATCGASDSNGNRECWIKSDADYLVLEL